MNVVRLERPEDEFDRFWAAYPRKVGKKKARAAFANARRDPDWPGIEAALTAIEAYKNGKPDYCDFCHPTTWLNEGRWDDEYDTTEDSEHKARLAALRAGQ